LKNEKADRKAVQTIYTRALFFQQTFYIGDILGKGLIYNDTVGFFLKILLHIHKTQPYLSFENTKRQHGTTTALLPFGYKFSLIFLAHQQIPLPAPHDAPASRMTSFAANHTSKHIELRFCGSSG
jgi:hypothetical protein